MLDIGVQTKNVVYDDNPAEGFKRLADAGFNCCDFSLNAYLYNKDIYAGKLNGFFSKSTEELCEFFRPHKEAAKANGIRINQMHMPYPIFVPDANDGINNFLLNQVAPKSMEIAKYLECPNIVIHGFKLIEKLGSEKAEWSKTAEFIDSIAPFAAENNIVICMENLYSGRNGHMIEGPGCDPVKAAARIDEFNRKYKAEVLGFCFDIGHANLVHLDFYDFLTTLGPRLKVLHLHDNDGERDLHQLPFTFTKTRDNTCSTNWPAFIKAMQDIKFDGVLSFETAPVLTSFPEELKDDALKMIVKIGRYLSDQIGGSQCQQTERNF